MKKIEYNTSDKKVQEFINTINETLEPIKAVCLDSFELNRNGVSINMYKVAISPLDILTFSMEHINEQSDEYGVERYEDTKCSIKHVKYDPSYKPKVVDMWPFSKVNLEKILEETQVTKEI